MKNGEAMTFEEWWRDAGRFEITGPFSRIDAEKIWEAAKLAKPGDRACEDETTPALLAVGWDDWL